MANSFYQPGPERAAKVGELFGAIANRYDLVNDLQSFGLHRLWKRRLARLARVGPGDRALDLCCGTGDVAKALARHGATVVGLDFSALMLAVAAQGWPAAAGAGVQRAPRLAFPAARASSTSCHHRWLLVCGDALRLPFVDESFDAVTISYGLRNLAGAAAGLQEMLRVARPGGRILVLDFGKPANRLWRWLYFGYLRRWVPPLGRMVAGSAEAYAYILESLAHYPAQQGVAALMRELGLTQVQVINLLGGAMSINYGFKPRPDPKA
jgi:demethylmenaquinone methyltransferase/2-methoxy-6-polyprenyl-1,4-benzoquinol methylase